MSCSRASSPSSPTSRPANKGSTVRNYFVGRYRAYQREGMVAIFLEVQAAGAVLAGVIVGLCYLLK